MTEDKLKDDVREQTGYTDVAILSEDSLDAAYRNAKRHIRVQNGLGQDFDWFDPLEPQREEALHWWTCLFAKQQTGDLDAQDLQIGAIDASSLLAKSNDDVTQWYRSARNAMRAIQPTNTFSMTYPARDNRQYGSDTSDGSAAGGLTDEL